MPRVFRQSIIAMANLILMLAMANINAMADCKPTHNQATELLDQYLHQAPNATGGKAPDPDAFETEFRPLVDQLQEEKCLPELMSLIQRIQSEQSKYPRPEKPSKPIPILE